ncbi:MAG: hypothetical protein L0Y73_01485 [Candidatus Aminicenantes bacterium]|nr:hypothetical protein [Candidatus Aminicenantes bacterium]
MKTSADYLLEEAEYFYREIFSAPVPAHIEEKYIAANLAKLPHHDERIRTLVLKKADIEAVELAWRFKEPRNMLTKKIHILVYLAETDPANFPRFFNTKKRRFVSFILLSWHFIRTAGKLMKGKFLLGRYRLV